MARGYLSVYFVLLALLLATRSDGLHDDQESAQLRYLEMLAHVSDRILSDDQFKADVIRQSETQQPKQFVDLPFNCVPDPSRSKPTSVHQLRPSDIDVVGAMGDEFTAGQGLGATGILEVVRQHRGESWSAGADFTFDEGYITIPNILRNLNPGVKGASTCTRFIQSDHSRFNVANLGAATLGLGRQATALVERMKNDTDVNLATDWKLITVQLGKGELCRQCGATEVSAEMFRNRVRSALDELYRELPRAFVNVVPAWDISYVPHINPTGISGVICNLAKTLLCNCTTTNETLVRVKPLQDEYFLKIKELIDSQRYEDKDDFTVVLQPHTRHFVPPKVDETDYDMAYFAADCASPSRLWHRWFAHTLWNVMLTPVGDKPETTTVGQYQNYFCPTQEHPYLYTAQNSPLKSTPAPSTTTTMPPHVGGAHKLLAGSGAMLVVVMASMTSVFTP